MSTLDPDRLAVNVGAITARMRAAQARGEQAAPEVDLIAVTKSAPEGVLALLPDVGITHIGENRVDQAAARRQGAPPALHWHGIGHLQRNKAAEAVRVFDTFHALDSIRLARRLDELAAGRANPWPVYLQVNASAEPQKGGFAPDEALDCLRTILTLRNLSPVGWMTMASAGAAERDLRQTFRTLRVVRDQAVSEGLGNPPPPWLSMGMSNDFEIAIEEGATSIRVGRALFDGVLKGDRGGGVRPSASGGTTGGAQA